MNRFLSILFLFFIFLSGCNPSWDFTNEDYYPQIVVEGWIENGNFPCVILTQTKNLNLGQDSMDVSDITIRWAKVTVSDGTQTEVLTGRMDERYFPPYVYSGIQIKGEAGKSYTLKVEYSGRELTAETYIPNPVSLDKIKIEKANNSDTLFQVKAFFSENKTKKNYYKFFSRVTPGDNRFFSSFMGTVDDNILQEEAMVTVFRGFRHYKMDEYIPFYKIQDTVTVKFTQLPKEGFDFWSSLENEVTNGKNPIFPSTANLKSNIQGGFGIWCGYGINTYNIIIRGEEQEIIY